MINTKIKINLDKKYFFVSDYTSKLQGRVEIQAGAEAEAMVESSSLTHSLLDNHLVVLYSLGQAA